MSQHVTSGYGQHTTVLLNIPHLSLAFLSVGDAKVLMAVFPSWPFSVNIPPTHRHTHTLLPCISLTGEDLLLESAQAQTFLFSTRDPGYSGSLGQELCWAAFYLHSREQSLGTGSLPLG